MFISELNHSAKLPLVTFSCCLSCLPDVGRHLHLRAERHPRGGGAAHQEHSAGGGGRTRARVPRAQTVMRAAGYQRSLSRFTQFTPRPCPQPHHIPPSSSPPPPTAHPHLTTTPCSQLDLEAAVGCYKRARRRLLVLGYNATLTTAVEAPRQPKKHFDQIQARAPCRPGRPGCDARVDRACELPPSQKAFHCTRTPALRGIPDAVSAARSRTTNQPLPRPSPGRAGTHQGQSCSLLLPGCTEPERTRRHCGGLAEGLPEEGQASGGMRAGLRAARRKPCAVSSQAALRTRRRRRMAGLGP